MKDDDASDKEDVEEVHAHADHEGHGASEAKRLIDKLEKKKNLTV